MFDWNIFETNESKYSPSAMPISINLWRLSVGRKYIENSTQNASQILSRGITFFQSI